MSIGMEHIHCPWEDNSPYPLLDICCRYLISHPDTFCDQHRLSGLWFLRPAVALPTELCEKLINLWQDKDPAALDDRFINIFRDLSCTRLKRVNVRNTSVSDDGLRVLLSHNLVELDISNCRKLTERTLDNINKFGDNLTTLVIGKTKDILLESLVTDTHTNSSETSDPSALSQIKDRGHILRTPNLRKLVVRELIQPNESEYFGLLLQPLTRLTHLDLAGCMFLQAKHLLPLKQLISLNLHSVQRMQEALPLLSELKNLKSVSC